MPSPTNPNKPAEQQLGCFGSFFKEIFDTVVSVVLFVGAYILVTILLLFIVDDSKSLRLLSGVGAFIVSAGILFFYKSIQAQRTLAGNEVRAKRDLEQADSWFFTTILSINVFLFGYSRRKLYTLAGLTVSITSIFVDFLIEIGSGDFISYFSFENWTLSRIVFSIGPFILGVVADWVKRKDSKLVSANFAAGLLMFISVLKLYPSILLFITGLIGGNAAFLAAHSLSEIISLEIFLFEWWPTSYQESNSYILLQELGRSYFVFIYFIIPVLVLWTTRDLRKRHDNRGPIDDETPMGIVNTAHYLSLIILIVPVIVGWCEGWLEMIFGYILYIITKIMSFFTGTT